ncbi:MAG: SLC13 family permease [Deltaproteobacteria bacterium]|jgi:di/tricarboxylate transporter|nr:SLC13 family permease [Deltaproteobacteria bacterium]MBW2533766.1 SLC13 family permease [Deltaproteobacteria bacterium]
MAVALVSVLLVAVIVLLVTEALPVDLTAVGVMVVLAVTGILTPAETLAGFSNPAPITIGVLFIVTQGLVRTGALDLLTQQVVRWSKGHPQRLLGLSLVLVGGFSSFLNNTPVVVLFLSITMAVCCEYGLSPSKFLLPISFVSILAGTSTLIGTSTNIIVSDLAAAEGLDPIGMFELSPLAMPVAMLGALFLYFFSAKLLRAHKEPVCEIKDDENQRYISELLVPAGSPLIGKEAIAGLAERLPRVELYEVLRGSAVIDPQEDKTTLQAMDMLLVKASASDLAQSLDSRCTALPKGDEGTIAKPYDDGSIIVELVVAPNAALVGRLLPNVLAEFDAHVHLLGVKRRHVHYGAHKVAGLRLAVGDILLIQAPVDHIDLLRATGDFIVVEDVVRKLFHRKKAPLALAIFLGMIGAATVGVTDILVAALAAGFLMLLTRCVGLREAYRALDARVLLLIIGTLALGAALSKTGAADLYAAVVLKAFSGAGPEVVLSGFILLTSLLSLFLSNNSTAVLLVPIALSSAKALGVDPRPFIIGICFGASACYASPIGYQTNLLVYGPGGYRFGDYVRLGLPLILFVWLASSWLIPVLWPL